MINFPLELTKKLSDNRENGMGGFSLKSKLLFPVLDEDKVSMPFLGWSGVCVPESDHDLKWLKETLSELYLSGFFLLHLNY